MLEVVRGGQRCVFKAILGLVSAQQKTPVLMISSCSGMLIAGVSNAFREEVDHGSFAIDNTEMMGKASFKATG